MANKVKYGLEDVHVATFTIDNSGEYVYDTPVAVPGAVNLSLDPVGDSNDFYADDLIYFNSVANQGYEGSLELAMITDYIRTAILGETTDANGALVEDANVTPKGFALGFKIKGDAKDRKFWYYNCSLTRPSNNAQTTETSIEPQTDTLNIKAMPRLSDKKVKSLLEKSDDNTAVYNSFFESVYEPALGSI